MINFFFKNEPKFYEWEHGKHSKNFTESQFYTLINMGKVVDGRQGGLIVGRSHSEGNIYFFIQNSDNSFTCQGNLQGGEYLINSYSAQKFYNNLIEINKQISYQDLNTIDKIEVTKSTIVLNTHGEPEKLLWLDGGQFIVNHYATRHFFTYIEQINSSF